MLLPQELKKYSFNRAMRGYNTAEVEEYITFVITKYEELYRENDDLSRKLSIAVESLAEMREREAKIAALEKAVKRAVAKLLAAAEKKRDEIVGEAAAYADRIVGDAEARVEEQKAQFERMQAEILTLRDTLFTAYSEHIDRIEALTVLAEEKDFSAPAPILADAAEEILSEDPAEENTAEEPQSADVYTEKELEEDETAEVTEEAPVMTAADEDIYTPEELSGTDPFEMTEADEEGPDAKTPAEEKFPDTDDPAELLAAFLDIEEAAATEDAAKVEKDLFKPEESEKDEESADVPEKIPAEEKPDDDALLRELHEVFAREFAAAEAEDAADADGNEVLLPLQPVDAFNLKDDWDAAQKAAPEEEAADGAKDEPNDDENLTELKRRMGLTDEIKKYPGIDSFEFIPEDALREDKKDNRSKKKNK